MHNAIFNWDNRKLYKIIQLSISFLVNEYLSKHGIKLKELFKPKHFTIAIYAINVIKFSKYYQKKFATECPC